MMLVIYGPTATGKTDFALQLADKLQGELISADSRQVYKGLDIGTGKVTFESNVKKHNGYWIVDGIKIHGFDLVDTGVNFSVADFLKSTSTSLIRINKVNKLPIVVGGTGFYIKALIDGLESVGVPADWRLRKKLSKLPAEYLYQKLLDLDQKRAKAMNESDRKNPRRLIRAVELALYRTSTSEESKPTSEVSRGEESPSTVFGTREHTSKVRGKIIGLTAPNDFLYERADSWLEIRLQRGMIDEVKNLLEKKVDPKWLSGLGLEYRWLTRYLLGQIGKQEAIERLKGDIHSFIRCQKTWFHQFTNIELFDISCQDWQAKLGKNVRL